MTWQQVVVALLLFVGTIGSIVDELRNERQSSNMTTLGIFLSFVSAIAWIAVLHSGGFW